MTNLTRFQLDLLIDIAGHPDTHGLAIKERLEDHYGHDINHGRLYPNLDSLAEQGLITKGTHDERTNKYALNRRGKRELEDRFAFFKHNVERTHEIVDRKGDAVAFVPDGGR